MRDDIGFFCKGSCHRRGAMMSYENHHVHPKEFHGPDTPANKVRICPNSHSNTHDLLNKIARGKPYDLLSYSPTERYLALRGWNETLMYAASIAPLRPPGELGA